MTGHLTRRRALAGAAMGLTALAGCTNLLESEPEEPDIDAAELAEIAEGDTPDVQLELPVSVTGEFIDEGVSRAQSLLEAIPDDLEEIPNEAVRGMIEENRERARDRLDELEGEPTERDALSALRGARRWAAEAAGAYQTAVDERTRTEALEEQRDLEAALEEVSGFEHVGDEPETALAVYETVEDRLSNVDQVIFGLEQRSLSPVASEVEAVERIDGRLEQGRASLAEATHLIDQQAAATDGGDFEEMFEDATRAILEEGEERLEALPTDVETQSAYAEAVFDTAVEGTPQEELADPGPTAESNYENAREDMETGYAARALMAAMRMQTDLLALEWLQSAVDEGEFDQPTDAESVRETRVDAVSAIEGVNANANANESERQDPYLLEYGLRDAIEMIERGDQIAEDGRRHNPPTATVVAQYAIGMARAESVSESVSRVKAALSA